MWIKLFSLDWNTWYQIMGTTLLVTSQVSYVLYDKYTGVLCVVWQELSYVWQELSYVWQELSYVLYDKSCHTTHKTPVYLDN